jgi:hypothetical protein
MYRFRTASVGIKFPVGWFYQKFWSTTVMRKQRALMLSDYDDLTIIPMTTESFRQRIYNYESVDFSYY